MVVYCSECFSEYLLEVYNIYFENWKWYAAEYREEYPAAFWDSVK